MKKNSEQEKRVRIAPPGFRRWDPGPPPKEPTPPPPPPEPAEWWIRMHGGKAKQD